MGGKGKASKLKHHGMSGIEEVAATTDAAFNSSGGRIDRGRGNDISRGKWGAASIAQSYRFYYWLFQYRNVMLPSSVSIASVIVTVAVEAAWH